MTGKWIEIGDNRIFNGDAVDLLLQIPNESIDLACFDPAYESLEKWRSTGTTTRLSHSKGSSNDWFQTFPNSRYEELFRELYRVLRPGSFLYMFCDEETRDVVCTGFSPQIGKHIGTLVGSTPPLIKAGFKYWKAIVWDKVYPGMGYHFPAQHEFILMAEKVERKGKHRKLNTNRPGDVLHAKRLKGKQFYPTEKPAALIWKLISESTNINDLVIDPFCGSGVVGTVCAKMGRRYILGDIKPEEAIRRLTNGKRTSD
jgi:site-specific DNA-methyltransferase (adenine-specific)